MLWSIVYRLALRVLGSYMWIEGIELKKIDIAQKIRLHCAIQLFDICFKIDSSKDAALFYVAKCYQTLEKHEKSLAYFKKVWERGSYNESLFRELETEYLILGRYEEGLQSAIKHVSEHPKAAGAHAQLAMFLLFLKRIDNAYDSAQRATSLDTNDAYVNGIYKYIMDVKSGTIAIPDKVLPDGTIFAPKQK